MKVYKSVEGCLEIKRRSHIYAESKCKKAFYDPCLLYDVEYEFEEN